MPRDGQMFEVRQDDLSSDQTRALLASHLAGMHAASPPGHVFALDLSGLQVPEVTVWTAWRDGQIASVGAMKMLTPDSAEIKSMRTHPNFIRKGAAASLLDTIIAAAKTRGLRRLSLETRQRSRFRASPRPLPASRFHQRPRLRRLRANRFQPIPTH